MLSSALGNPARKVLTDAQMRTLARRAGMLNVEDPDRELTIDDLQSIGYCAEDARRIVQLLDQQDLLQWYLKKAKAIGCSPITRVSEAYPHKLRQRLGQDCPGCLWAKGDKDLLRMPSVGLVGARDLNAANCAFAREVGIQAAKQGFALVSGNARGADREAQNACLEHGGYVISVVADRLFALPDHDRVLYLSEGGFDLDFTPQRALHRNKIVHSLADRMFVAQSNLEVGGTWNGTVTNLRGHYSPVFCFRDGSEAANRLEQMGATLVDLEELSDFDKLQGEISLFIK